jgi:hypothetical protein
MINRIILVLIIILVLPATIYASAEDYLILQDMGIYKLFTGIQGRSYSGPPRKYRQINSGGVLQAADHFSENDICYEASYTQPSSKWPFVKVDVTQHAGGDSDKWLMHELDDAFRDDYGIPDISYSPRQIDGNTVLVCSSGGRDYRWISGYKVISIEYTDFEMEKPEPLEVVKAYLAKHPSSIKPFTTIQLRTADNKIMWIKDEMERRLWLCDKWFAALQEGKAVQEDVLSNVIESMTVFIKYREKYYGVSATTDKNALNDYNKQHDIVFIKNKLMEYKSWWASHKDGIIRDLIMKMKVSK